MNSFTFTEKLHTGIQILLIVIMTGSGVLSRAIDNVPESMTIQSIPSPFSKDGSAVVLKSKDGKNGVLRWESDEVVPGEKYTVSFFFQNRVIRNAANLDLFRINIYDGHTRIFHQRLYTKNHPQFFTVDLVFSSTRGVVRIETKPGNEIVLGEFGRALDVAELALVRFPHSSVQWTPKLQLPAVYRGLRKFEIGVSLWKDASNDLLGLESVTVRAKMNLAAAKAPAMLPGRNELEVKFDSGGPDARLRLRASARGQAKSPYIDISHDELIPADGATFGRVFLSAVEDGVGLISGAFFRLRAPTSVNVYPYVKAISDWQKMQTTREFHLTSLVPGTYEIGIDRWDGDSWVKTQRTFEVVFEKIPAPAPEFHRPDYTRAWLEPRRLPDGATTMGEWDIPLSDDRSDRVVEVNFPSPLAPRWDWEISGPVQRLALFCSFQPDPRTLRETARSLWESMTLGSGQPERDFIFGVEEYVGLFMEGTVPEPYCLMDYPSYGRLHREGRGWCWQYSAATYALALEGGLQSRFRNVPRHVMVEVKGQDLEPMLIDAMLQVAVTEEDGSRTVLNRVGDEDTRVLGAGVHGLTRRGKFSGYLESPLEHDGSWNRFDPDSIVYQNAFMDDTVFSIDLHAWETLSWSSGSLSELNDDDSRGSCAENQTILTKVSMLHMTDLPSDSAIRLRQLERNEFGQLTPKTSAWGYLKFPFECPVEVEEIFISTTGTIGAGGRMAISLTPVMNRPLIEGLSGFLKTQ